MSEITIHNFQYFLEELEKNLRKMDSLREQEAIELERMYVLHNVMSKMLKGWAIICSALSFHVCKLWCDFPVCHTTADFF